MKTKGRHWPWVIAGLLLTNMAVCAVTVWASMRSAGPERTRGDMRKYEISKEVARP